MVLRNPLDRVPVLSNIKSQLVLALVFDIIGLVTYLVPVIGEFGDILWAPINGAFIATMVGREGKGGWAFVVFGIVEELLPFTDFLFSCTMAWTWKYLRHWRH